MRILISPICVRLLTIYLCVYLSGVRCGDPESGHNAVGLIAGSYPGDHVTYACRDGYEIEAGNEKRICQENKTWSGEPLRCKGKQTFHIIGRQLSC